MANIFDQLDGAAKKTVESIESADRAVGKLSRSVLEGGKGFEDLVASVGELSSMTRQASGAIGDLVGVIPGLGAAGRFISGLGGIMGNLVGVVESLGKAYIGSLNAFDSFSSGLRRIDADMYDLTLRFGGTFDEARKFADGLLSASRRVSGAEFGFINVTELQETAKQLAGNRITFEKFSDTVSTSAGTMDLLTTATLQAGASGLETSDYFSKLGDAIMKQGLNTEGAVEQIASFREVADDTGLTVSSVAGALNDLSNSFAQIGLSADFGRPLLTGFARTLDDMGLGIENAIGLSGELSGALASLTTDYATAFITAQRGGMDLGSGGVLGAGIQLQARLLDAQSSGDEEAQADIARDLATGLKDTLASFAGGQIVTVQDAAANPALEAQFFAQTKILQDMYGINENSAARTLELLTGLDEATRTGDQDAADALAQQIEQQISARDETLDLMDKQNALTAGILAESMMQTRALLYLPRTLGQQMIMEPANAALESQFETMQKSVIGFQEKALSSVSNMESEGDIMGQLNSLFSTQKDSLEASANRLSENTVAAQAGTNPGVQTTQRTGNESIDRLITSMERLIGELRQGNSGRNSAAAAGGAGYTGGR